MRIEQLTEIVDVFSKVEILEIGNGIIYRGLMKDLRPQNFIKYDVYSVDACSDNDGAILKIYVR